MANNGGMAVSDRRWNETIAKTKATLTIDRSHSTQKRGKSFLFSQQHSYIFNSYHLNPKQTNQFNMSDFGRQSLGDSESSFTSSSWSTFPSFLAFLAFHPPFHFTHFIVHPLLPSSPTSSITKLPSLRSTYPVSSEIIYKSQLLISLIEHQQNADLC